MDTKTDVLKSNPKYDSVKKYYGQVVQKTSDLKDACEDYGQIAVYNGQMSESPFKFELNDKHVFYKNKPERVCDNTAIMLSGIRFNKYFQVIGNFKEHFGAFQNLSSVGTKESNNSSNCC